MPDREIGIGINQAGREPQLQAGAFQVGPRPTGGLLRLPPEITVLGKGYLPPRALPHPLDAAQAPAGRKGRIHERQQHTAVLCACALPPHRPPFPRRGSGQSARVLRLRRTGRNGPGAPKLLYAPDPSCCAVPLNQPHRNSPFLCRFPNGDVLHRLSPQPDGFPFFPDHYIRFCALFSSGNLHQFSVPRKPPPRRARSCALSRSSLPRPGRAQKKQPSCRTAASHVVAEAGFEPTTFGL